MTDTPNIRAVEDPIDTDGDEINVDPGEFFQMHDAWTAAEGDANSDAGTRRQEMGAYQKKTGVNGKAFSQVRAGLKMKKETDRLDWLRSMKILLGIAEQRIRSESSDEMDFDAPKAAAE